MTKPVPVNVDASPAQIPRKSEAVTVSSIAPPSPTAKDSQETTYAPPSTVTIPSQIFAPPPPQDSTRDTLSFPTIRSCMNYNTIPIEYTYLIDVEDYSSEDELRSHGELLADNRRRRRHLGRKIKELSAKVESKKAKKPEEQYRRDALDQKTFTSEFRGTDSHMMFREDLRTETLTCRNWRNLIKIKTNDSEHNLLNQYMLLTYEDLTSAKNKHQANKIATSRNMYIAI